VIGQCIDDTKKIFSVGFGLKILVNRAGIKPLAIIGIAGNLCSIILFLNIQLIIYLAKVLKNADAGQTKVFL
jgi:hypothetical protein